MVNETENTTTPKRITLKRKSISEIKVVQSSGRKTTVNVVSKRSRVYVKKDAHAEETVLDVLEAPLSSSLETTQPATGLGDGGASVKPEGASEKTGTAVSREPTVVLDVADGSGLPTKSASAVTHKKVTHREGQDEEVAARRHRPKSKPPGRNERQKGGEEFDWHQMRNKVIRELDEEEEVRKERERIQKDRRLDARVLTLQRNLRRHAFSRPQELVRKVVRLPAEVTVQDLAQQLSLKVEVLLKTLARIGVTGVGPSLDQTVAQLLVEELGHEARLVAPDEARSVFDVAYEQEDIRPRPPVVTVMGHVDHGKTSLLDYIRRTKVAAGEAGGITQHIGAYHVKVGEGHITFLDTPGHAAFTAMRARGAKVTDLVILVVAADDGVMPQTKEAIQHARAAQVPVIVAVNKIDKGSIDLERIQTELSNEGLISEAWGGDTMFVPVSARTGAGIDQLLEAILLQAEVLELKAPHRGPAQGIVLEARLDKGKGPVISFLTQKGCLKVGDILLAGTVFGRVRALSDENGRALSTAGPSIPVEMLGLSGLPAAGDMAIVVKDEKTARDYTLLTEGEERLRRQAAEQPAPTLENLFQRLQSEKSQQKCVDIVLKADVQGSAEALREALGQLSSPEVQVRLVSLGVGGITEGDVNLALVSKALLIGFNVRTEAQARKLAEREGLEARYYSVIYDVVDQVKQAMSGLLSPLRQEKIVGVAQVREVFHSSKLGAVAGCMVIEGHVKRGLPIRVLRDNVVVYQGDLESLRRFKDDVQEVRQGMECGIGVKNYNDVKVGDQIEVYEVIQVARQI